ncbi:hypothetical protein D3C81_1720310 [compost metagenome]
MNGFKGTRNRFIHFEIAAPVHIVGERRVRIRRFGMERRVPDPALNGRLNRKVKLQHLIKINANRASVIFHAHRMEFRKIEVFR